MIGLSTISNPILYISFSSRYRAWLRRFACCGYTIQVVPVVNASAAVTINSHALQPDTSISSHRPQDTTTKSPPQDTTTNSPPQPPIPKGGSHDKVEQLSGKQALG